MFKFKSKKIILSLTLLVTLTLVGGLYVVNAAETQQSLDNKIDNAENKLEENEKKQESISGEITTLQGKIKTAEEEVSALTDELISAQAEVEAANAKLAEQRKKLEKGNQDLQSRLRNIYKSGSIGFVDVMLSSENVSDLFSNFEMVTYIFKNDKNIVTQLKSQYATIEKEASQLAAKEKDLQTKQNQIANKQSALGADYRSLAAKNKSIESENAKLEQQIAKWQADSLAIADQINNAQNGGNGYTGESSQGFVWPVPGYKNISSPYGWRMLSGKPDFHLGIDIPTNKRPSAVVAAKNGKVIATGGQHWSYGNIVIIDHGNGVATAYAHNSSIVVKTGQIVKQGQTIAYTGNTGNSFGIHLHFEVRINGKTVNPMAYL